MNVAVAAERKKRSIIEIRESTRRSCAASARRGRTTMRSAA